MRLARAEFFCTRDLPPGQRFNSPARSRGGLGVHTQISMAGKDPARCARLCGQVCRRDRGPHRRGAPPAASSSICARPGNDTSSQANRQVPARDAAAGLHAGHRQPARPGAALGAANRLLRASPSASTRVANAAMRGGAPAAGTVAARRFARAPRHRRLFDGIRRIASGPAAVGAEPSRSPGSFDDPRMNRAPRPAPPPAQSPPLIIFLLWGDRWGRVRVTGRPDR